MRTPRSGRSHSSFSPAGPAGGAPALQVAYFRPAAPYSLHYFPYYGKKAQVRGPRA